MDKTREEIDLMDEGGVLDDERVGLHHWLASTNLAVVDATKRDNWGTGSLGTEARERLGVTTFVECRDREKFGRGDHTLTTPAVETNLEHTYSIPYESIGGNDTKCTTLPPWPNPTRTVQLLT